MISNYPYSNDNFTPILIFHQLKNSNTKITCSRRPSLRSIASFKEVYGLNAILSCITKNEKPQQIEEKTKENNMKFFNIPFKKAKAFSLEKEDTKNMLIHEIKEIYNILMNEDLTILVHCAAGVRRTGIIVYSILRMNGETKESALDIILKLREETRNGIGDYRIEYTEKYIVPKLLETKEIKSNSSNKII
jgi:protein tyrosine/serine phosphatase